MKSTNKKRVLTIGFFHDKAYFIGWVAFVSSLIFSCNYMLQFAPEIESSSVLSYVFDPDFWTKFALVIAGFAFMGGQIITFVMYKKCKKLWVFKLYIALTAMSIFATFGSFATGLEKRRIAAGQSDTTLQALNDKKSNIKSMITTQENLITMYTEKGWLTNGVNKVAPKLQANVESLNNVNDEIAAYTKEGNIGHDSTAEMFVRVASVIQIFSFGGISDATRDIIAMLLECIAFLLVAICIDYTAAVCAVIAVRVTDDEFQEILNDEATEHARESASKAMVKEDKLTHNELMKGIKARKAEEIVPLEYKESEPDIRLQPHFSGYNSSSSQQNVMQIERIMPSSHRIPTLPEDTSLDDMPRNSTGKIIGFSKSTLLEHIKNMFHEDGTGPQDGHLRGHKRTAELYNAVHDVGAMAHKWLKSADLISVKGPYSYPKMSQSEMIDYVNEKYLHA